jgi:peptidoglycan hydrolase-like protein with peptidoglycan-binding domain|tara:strand:- start:4075 stop:4911 length:837 start_codon:yes stop_codon:yes gene_type:complete
MGAIVKRGDSGPHVIEIQKGLNAIGLWSIGLPYSQNFGPATDRAIRKFQKINGLVVDGKVGKLTLSRLGIHIEPSISKFDEKYKGVTFQGSVFPDKPISWNVRVKFNSEMLNEYIPVMESLMRDEPKGLRLLITIMAYKEGFRKGTRSYRHNNPGNIGNTDSGANSTMLSLLDGIDLQQDYINSIVNGTHRAYPMGRRKCIKPYFSKEIAKHTKLYGMSPYVPGYNFKFTGQLDQFVKIYSTGARAGNGYLSMIISYFKKNGIYITPQSKIQDIIKLN